MSRGFVDEQTNSLVAAFRYPGEIGFVGTMDLATGKLRKLAELKGMMLYWVTSIAFDPESRKAYYVEDNRAYRDLFEVNIDTGKRKMLLRDSRIGDLAINPRDKSIWACGTRTAMRPSFASRRLTPASTRSTPSTMGLRRSTSIFRPTER